MSYHVSCSEGYVICLTTLSYALWLRYGCLKFPGTPKFSKFQMPISWPLGVKTHKFLVVLFISLGDTPEPNLNNFGDVVV